MYPPIFYFITPFLNFSGVQRERERKTHPFFKRNLRVKSQIPPFFYNSRAGLCRTKSTPLPEILGTRMRSLRPRSGGGRGQQGQFKGEMQAWNVRQALARQRLAWHGHRLE